MGFGEFSIVFTIEIMSFEDAIELSEQSRKTGGLYLFIAERSLLSGRAFMHRYMSIVCVFVAWFLAAQSAPPSPSPTKMSEPLRVVIVGLVHGHVEGFLQQSLHNPKIEIVASSNRRTTGLQIRSAVWLRPAPVLSDLEEMLNAGTSEGRTGLHKHLRPSPRGRGLRPARSSRDDGKAFGGQHRGRIGDRKGSASGRIQVLVNYETTWYPSNRAAYDLVTRTANWESCARSLSTMATGPQGNRRRPGVFALAH